MGMETCLAPRRQSPKFQVADGGKCGVCVGPTNRLADGMRDLGIEANQFHPPSIVADLAGVFL